MDPITQQAPDGQITVVIADDHAVVRTGLRMLIEAEEGMEVVAEAGDADSARRYVLGHKPTVLMLDLNMPGEASLDAIPKIHEASPETKIVVLTMQEDPAFARAAMSAGASGYILKEAADAELVSAIRLAADGGIYLYPRVGARMASGSAEDELSALTEREIEIMKLIALGYTNTEIAEQLFLSVRTIESHRAHIQNKLDFASRAELVRFAIDHGLIDVSPA
ncbi:MAG: response regulator transcription factor [Thermoleophilaceae bacterium]|nr:response regulator transcription factor [Thermoleophilaceae bacterium]